MVRSVLYISRRKRMASQDYRSRWLKRVVLTGLSLLATSAWAGQGKLSRELQNTTTTQDVIIQFTTPANAAMLDDITSKGGKFKTNFSNVKSAVYRLTPATIETLAANGNVRFMSPVRTIT